ncbi:hypothetical protein M5D96_003256 [Drosophila gunungcola]|uniref:Uncharacterized protein n=1 Tax=Drosophila gunungcola TaxID=103775 RepID=A0A9Q0BS71_9MUSC|nr:hypothetical protein M5D96_003256 [Drosophila gunungcola]
MGVVLWRVTNCWPSVKSINKPPIHQVVHPPPSAVVSCIPRGGRHAARRKAVSLVADSYLPCGRLELLNL